MAATPGKGFGNRAPAAGGNGAARGSRWGGIPSNEPKEPIIKASVNPQRVRLDSCEITYNDGNGNETFKSHFTVLESDVHEAGEKVVALYLLSGKSKKMGEGRVQAMSVALMGCDGDADFHAKFPTGAPIEAALNGATEGATLLGREAYTIVSKGGVRDDGDYYREFEWASA